MATGKQIGTKKWWAIGAISLASIAFGLDLTVLNLALPTLSRSLHASTSQLQWFVDAYSLALAVMLLPAGLLGDRYGRKKCMLLALALFGVASLACAYSQNPSELIAARVALGIGGAFILPLALSTVAVFFNDSERPKALALLFGANFAAFPLGPILGGYLLTHYWWGSVFLINVPIVLIALLAISLLLPESRSQQRPQIDYQGLVLSSLGLAGITYGAIEAESHGWGSAHVLLLLALGAFFSGLFVLAERRKQRLGQQPLVDLDLFASPGFTWGAILATGVSFAMFGLLFTIPQYFQSVEGKTALEAGLRLLPMIAGLIIGSVISSRLARSIGAKITVAVGFAFLAIALAIGAHTTINSSDRFAAEWIGLMGLGLGFSMPIALDAAIGALTPERSGVGSSLLQVVRQVGSTLGVAVLGSVLGASYRSHLHLAGLPPAAAAATRSSINGGIAVAQQLQSPLLLADVRQAFVYGMHSLLWVCVGIALVSIVLALVFLPNKPAAATTDAQP